MRPPEYWPLILSSVTISISLLADCNHLPIRQRGSPLNSWQPPTISIRSPHPPLTVLSYLSHHHQPPPPPLWQQSTRHQTSIAAGAAQPGPSPLKRVCYFRMDPKTEIRLGQVDGNLCTHLILAFVRIDPLGNICPASPTDLAYLSEVEAFKRRFPAVKVMISVFNELEFNGFPKAALSVENRQRFARSTMEFLQRYHLDGVDLDWEFPNFPTTFVGREHERTGLTKILKSLRSAIVENFYDRQVAQQHLLQTSDRPHLKSHAPVAPVEPYLLTMAVAGQEAVLRASYELRQVANLCDWLNIMTYDYFLFKPYAPFTGPNSPLHPVVEPYVPIVGKLSVAWTLGRLLEEGIARDKLVLGIPTYARAYRLVFRQQAPPAPFTLALGAKAGGRVEDYLDYREVGELLAREDTVVEWDQRARVPYLLADSGYTWVSYENPQSVREKARFVMENNLAGYMTWNLNSDDFVGGASKSPQQHPNGHLLPPDSSGGPLDLAPFPLHRAMLDEVSRFQNPQAG